MSFSEHLLHIAAHAGSTFTIATILYKYLTRFNACSKTLAIGAIYKMCFKMTLVGFSVSMGYNILGIGLFLLVFKDE